MRLLLQFAQEAAASGEGMRTNPVWRSGKVWLILECDQQVTSHINEWFTASGSLTCLDSTPPQKGFASPKTYST